MKQTTHERHINVSHCEVWLKLVCTWRALRLIQQKRLQDVLTNIYNKTGEASFYLETNIMTAQTFYIYWSKMFYWPTIKVKFRMCFSGWFDFIPNLSQMQMFSLVILKSFLIRLACIILMHAIANLYNLLIHLWGNRIVHVSTLCFKEKTKRLMIS